MPDTRKANNTPNLLGDGAPLGLTARLLGEAQALVERATQDAAEKTLEFTTRIQGLEENLGEMEQLLIRTERQAAQLANLYVATYQLHASLVAEDVRAAVADIAVNLLGAEEFTIWIQDDKGQLERAPESSTGSAAPPPEARYAGGDALIDASLRSLAPEFGELADSRTVAAVPFVAHGAVVGLLAMHRFFGHKKGLSSEDRELLDMMAAHAASAVLAARAFHVTQRKLHAYEGLLGFLRRGPE
jgi:GAF domain-containing protein